MIRHLIVLFAVSLLLGTVDRAAAQSPKFLQRTAAEWTSQLKSGDAAARRNAAFALGKMGNYAEKSLPALKQAMRQEKDNRAREAMVCAAGEIAFGSLIDDVELEAMLIEALGHADKLVRRSAACALGQTGSKHDAVRNALAGALKDPEQLVRQNAAWALGQLDERAIPAIQLALADATSDALVKRDAANALFAVGRADPAKMRPAMNDLLAMCSDADAEVRKAGLVPLVRMITDKDVSAVPVLNKTLRDPDPEVRRYAALALSNIGGDAAADAVPILIETLRNGELQLKRSAAVALHNVGKAAAPAVPELIKALQDPDPELRKNAALALGGIGEAARDAVRSLVQIMTNASQPIEVRVQAAEALTFMKNIPAVRENISEILKVLGNANEDGNVRVRLAWLFNAFIQDQNTMAAAIPVMDRVCAERDSKENGSTRYHCAFLLGIVARGKAPESALNVLADWLHDSTGKLYGGQSSKVGAEGVETKGGAEVKTVLTGDSRVMAVDALRFIGRERVRDRKDIVDQLGVLVKDSATHKELRAEATKLLNLLGK